MARKEFKYRGYSGEQLKALSLKEFMMLLPARERRSLARGFTPEEQSLINKLEKRDKVNTHERQMVILPSMIGKVVSVHSGKEFVDVHVTDEMIGRRLGQFVLTRKKAAHSSGGVSKGADKAKK